MLTHAEVMAILKETGVYKEGHFLLTSGRHSDKFLLCPQVLQYPPQTERLCRAMAEPWQDLRISVVVGPATGGILLAYELARALGCRAIFTEKTPEGMELRRGFKVSPGERVLMVEDALSTGGSVMASMAAIRPFQPEIVGVSVLVDRTAGQVDMGVPLKALMTLDIPSWEPARCPLCQRAEPLVKPKAK